MEISGRRSKLAISDRTMSLREILKNILTDQELKMLPQKI
jgi:hypothetical protein